MRKTVLFLSLIAAITLSSCSSSSQKSELIILRTKVSSLETEITRLKSEIALYEMSPDKLLLEAEGYFKSKDLFALSGVFENIVKYHPASTEKTTIGNMLSKLRDEEGKAEAKREQEKLTAVSRMKKKVDDINGTTWYENPYFTHYNNSNLTSLYIGQKGDNVWIRLKMSYKGDNWIFFDNAYLSFNGITKEFVFDEYREKKTEVGNGVWEWIDIQLKDAELSFLKTLAMSDNAKMRLSGKYTKDRNLSVNEKKGIHDAILAYEVLKKR